MTTKTHQIFVYGNDKKQEVVEKVNPSGDTLTDNSQLRYLSTYYPPSFGNMFRYVLLKYRLGGTKRRKRRSKRRYSFKN